MDNAVRGSRLKNLSYRKKIFGGMILAALLPMIVAYIAIIEAFYISNNRTLANESELVINSSCEIIEKNINTVVESLRLISDMPAASRMLIDNELEDISAVYRQLYTEYRNNGTCANYAIYDTSGVIKLYIGDNEYTRRKISTNWGIIYTLNSDPSRTVIRNAKMYVGTQRYDYLRIGRAIVDDSGDILGYVISVISNNEWTDMFSKLNLERLGSLYILDEYEELVFSSSELDKDNYKTAVKELLDENHKYGLHYNSYNERFYYQDKNKEYRFYHQNSDDTNLHIVYRQHVENFYSTSRSLLSIVVFAGILSLVLCLFISRYMSIRFYKPIHRMTTAMEKIKGGQFDVQVKVDNEDELGQLSMNFNEMSNRLTDNMNQLVNREKELSEANIKMMQAQLNPHFIYNTLDTMKWIGKENEMEEVATLSSGLADIMRASISSSQIVTLKKELDLIESYAEIQKIRFDDKFELLIDFPSELYNCSVPKLILQPIVENAIIHGFENRDYGEVMVYGYIRDERLYIFVKDNGIGMDAETRDKLNSHVQLAKGSNIGFHNVDAIIRLNFGDEYGLFVTSEPGKGCEVKYTLPVRYA